MLRRPAGKARKRKEYLDISSFRNATRRDGWAPKMLSYCLREPLVAYRFGTDYFIVILSCVCGEIALFRWDTYSINASRCIMDES